MSLHADVLSQARHLVQREPRRPRQASLRRAVSSAYYARFHLLTYEASRTLVTNKSLRQLMSRAFIHAEMNRTSKAFAGGTLSQRFNIATGGTAIPSSLKDVAQAFVDLQEARHEADYNMTRSFSRAEAQAYYRLHPEVRDRHRALFLLDEIQVLPGWESFARRPNLKRFRSAPQSCRN